MWLAGSMARLPVLLLSASHACAASKASPSWVKVDPASKLQFTSILNVAMSW